MFSRSPQMAEAESQQAHARRDQRCVQTNSLRIELRPEMNAQERDGRGMPMWTHHLMVSYCGRYMTAGLTTEGLKILHDTIAQYLGLEPPPTQTVVVKLERQRRKSKRKVSVEAIQSAERAEIEAIKQQMKGPIK